MTTYTKQVYKDYNFTYKITKEGYWDKTATKSISSNTTETVTLEPYDGVTVTYGTPLTTVSSGVLPDGSAFGGYTGTPSGDYGKNYLIGVDGTSSGTMSLVPGLMFDRDANMIKTYNMFYFADGTIGMTSETSKEGGTWLWSYTGKIALTWAWVANFEQAGDVTYTDKVAGGFNASSYLTAEIATKTSIGSYTFITKVTVATSPKTQAGVGNSENDKSYVRIFSSSTLGIWNGSENQGTFTVTGGNVYWVALHYNGENTVQYVLEDNSYTLETLPEFTNWTSNVTVEGSFMSDIFGNKMYIGRHVNDSTSGEYWGGTIDLENTVLKGRGSYFETPETVWWKALGTY